jgi:hypothetical protein
VIDPGVIRKHETRPGFDLVSFREVALPLFAVTLDVLVLDEKPLPPIQEFVLRSVDAGMSDITSISGLLGIDQRMTTRAAAELMHSDDVVLSGVASGDRRHRLTLTEKGIETLAAAKIIQPIETQVTVFIDGLTRRVLAASRQRLNAFPMRYAEERGLVEIAAHPRRKPRFDEIPASVVAAVVAEEGAGRRLKREVIGVVGMGKVRTFARDALALAYRSQTSDEMLVSFIVDGAPAEDHDAAFSRAQRYSARRLVPDDWEPAIRVISHELPADVVELAAPTEESLRLSRLQSEAADERREAAAAVDRARPDGEDTLRRKLEEAEQREASLLSALESLSVRHLSVYEHPDYLEKAFSDARSRLLIVSPWIRAEVVDGQFVSRLRKALDRDVEVYIGYGIGDNGRDRRHPKAIKRDQAAEGELRRVAAQYRNFHLSKFGDTHAKVLVCDSRFCIVTSFNWLSFRGDQHLHFRDERGMYIGIREHVDALFNEYASRFDSR